MIVPDINLEDLRKWKEKNFQDRMNFLEKYTEWLKKTPNKVWSKQQKDIIG